MRKITERDVWLLGAVAAVLVMVASWFLLISPELSDADSAHAQAQSVQADNQLEQVKVDGLRAKHARLGIFTTKLKQALEALPYDSALPAFTRQVAAQASVAHADLQSVTVAGLTPVTSTAPAPATAGSASATSAPATGTTGTGATADTATGAAPSTGLFQAAITLKVEGSFRQILDFVHSVQYAGPRRALVTAVQYTAGTSDTRMDASVQLTVYSAAQTTDQIALFNSILNAGNGN